MIKGFSIFVILMLLVSPVLVCDEVEDKINTGLSLYQKGKSDECITSLAEAIMLLQNRKELVITQVALCSAIRGYRDYTPIEGDTLKAGDPVLVYIEVEGFNVVKEKDRYWMWISEDLTVIDEKGKVLVNKKDWLNNRQSYVVPVFPLYIPNSIKNIQPGKYRYAFTIKDHLKKTFVEKAFIFEVKAPPEKSAQPEKK